MLGDAEGDDVARVVGSVEAFGAHYARVVECTVSISIIERGQNGFCKAGVERVSWPDLLATKATFAFLEDVCTRVSCARLLCEPLGPCLAI